MWHGSLWMEDSKDPGWTSISLLRLSEEKPEPMELDQEGKLSQACPDSPWPLSCSLSFFQVWESSFLVASLYTERWEKVRVIILVFMTVMGKTNSGFYDLLKGRMRGKREALLLRPLFWGNIFWASLMVDLKKWFKETIYIIFLKKVF
jgi:hypothetical protein